MNEQVDAQLDVLMTMFKERPEVFTGAPENRSELINLMLNDYADFLITNFKKGKKYAELKKQLSELNTRKKVSNVDKLAQATNNKISALLYLMISTNQALARIDMDDWKNIQSMYTQGTKENEIYSKLQEIVEEDKIKLFRQQKTAGRRIKE